MAKVEIGSIAGNPNDKKYRYYHHNFRFKTEICTYRISAPMIESAVFFVIGQVLGNQALLTRAIEEATKHTRESGEKLRKEIVSLKSKQQNLHKQKSRLIDAVMNGTLSQDDVRDRINKIREQLEET